MIGALATAALLRLTLADFPTPPRWTPPYPVPELVRELTGYLELWKSGPVFVSCGGAVFDADGKPETEKERAAVCSAVGCWRYELEFFGKLDGRLAGARHVPGPGRRPAERTIHLLRWGGEPGTPRIVRAERMPHPLDGER